MPNVEFDLESANLLEGRDDCQNLRAKQAGSYLWTPSPASLLKDRQYISMP